MTLATCLCSPHKGTTGTSPLVLGYKNSLGDIVAFSRIYDDLGVGVLRSVSSVQDVVAAASSQS